MAKKWPKWVLPLIAVILIIGLIIGIYWYLVIFPNSTGTGFGQPTEFEFYVNDYATGDELDDAEIFPFECDISNMTEAEVADLAFADFSAVSGGALHSGDTLEPEADHTYWCKANFTDHVDYWFQPILGNNTIRLMNLTEDVSLLAYSTPVFSTTVPTTFAGAHYDDWTLVGQTLDAAESETAVSTLKEGFKPYYDFELDAWNFTVIRIEFNDTASLSYCELKESFTFTEKCTVNYTYFEINVAFVGELLLDIEFGSTQGSSFEIEGFAIGYGTADDFTAWDTI